MAMTPYDLLMVITLSIVGLIFVVQFFYNCYHGNLALATVSVGLVFVILPIIGHIASCLSDETGGRVVFVGLILIFAGMLLKHFEDAKIKNRKYISKK